MIKIFRHFSHFWSEERNLTLLFGIVVFDFFILPSITSLAGERPLINLVSNLVLSLLLLTGVIAMTRHKVIQAVFTAVVALIITVRWVNFFFGGAWLKGWDIFLALVAAVTFVVVVLGHVYKEGPITGHRIQGAVVAYVLIAMAFAMAYFFLEFLLPGSFRFPNGALVINNQSWRDFYYFSVVTLATLGYGDVTPVHPVARNLAMAEALIGQLYPAILLARLVSLHIQTKPKKGE